MEKKKVAAELFKVIQTDRQNLIFIIRSEEFFEKYIESSG